MRPPMNLDPVGGQAASSAAHTGLHALTANTFARAPLSSLYPALVLSSISFASASLAFSTDTNGLRPELPAESMLPKPMRRLVPSRDTTQNSFSLSFSNRRGLESSALGSASSSSSLSPLPPLVASFARFLGFGDALGESGGDHARILCST